MNEITEEMKRQAMEGGRSLVQVEKGYFTVYIVHTVGKDGYMEHYKQTIGKNVYAVRGKFIEIL